MRKASIIAMAALALLTAQCKKNEPKPEEKVMVPITGSVDFGGSKTEITTSGMINPKDGDVIYIYYNNGSNVSNVGSMTCTAQTGQQFTCSGTINVNCLGKTCTFMYLGSNNGTNGDSGSISFVDQTGVSVIDGKISGLDKFHVGSCQAQVSTDGKVTLPMATKMSIAYFKLTDGTNPIANKIVTISGVYATANIDKENGTISVNGTGNGTGNIAVRTDAQGKFYMALVPQSGPVTFSFSGPGDGTTTFPNGIRECSFYSNGGSGSPLEVEVTPKSQPKFTVGNGTTVEFSPGNLYWDGSAFKFEANQWSFADTWNSSHVSHFFWSKTASVAYDESYDESGTSYTDEFFTNLSSFQVDCETAGTWHTLDRLQWSYLLYSRPDASSLYAWKELDSGTHNGLVILPDGTDASVMSGITSIADLASSGAVFLPVVGVRTNTSVSSYGDGDFWSSTPDGAYDAKSLYFSQWGPAGVSEKSRYDGRAVRLVRSAS